MGRKNKILCRKCKYYKRLKAKDYCASKATIIHMTDPVSGKEQEIIKVKDTELCKTKNKNLDCTEYQKKRWWVL